MPDPRSEPRVSGYRPDMSAVVSSNVGTPFRAPSLVQLRPAAALANRNISGAERPRRSA